MSITPVTFLSSLFVIIKTFRKGDKNMLK